MVQIDESFNGKQIEIQVQETLEITLPENVSTGFRWVIPPEAASGIGKLFREGETVAEGTANPPGKPGVRHFYFEAVSPGTVELELQCLRPWETAKPPARKFNLNIRVRAA